MFQKTNAYSHLKEIRLRGSYLVMTLGLTFIVAYFHSPELTYLICRPVLLCDKGFIFTEITEAFLATVFISLLITLFLVIPVTFYQIFSFLVPTLYEQEKKRFCFYQNLFLLGLYSAFITTFFVFLPIVCPFFFGFELESQAVVIQVQTRILSYLWFIATSFFFICISFQAPLLCIFLLDIGLITPYNLASNRRLMIPFCLVVGSLIAPPDLGTQLGVTFWLLSMYEFLIWISFFYKRLVEKKKK